MISEQEQVYFYLSGWLDRASDCGSEDRGFESFRGAPLNKKASTLNGVEAFCFFNAFPFMCEYL